jgi:hypothetical protein
MDTALAMVLVMDSEDPPLPPSLIRSPPLPESLSEAMVLVTDTVPPMALAMAVLVTDPVWEYPLFRPLEESECLAVTELDMVVLATGMEMLEVPDSIDQFMS